MEKKTIEVIIPTHVEGEVDPAEVAPKTPPEGDDAARWHYEWVECNGGLYRFWVSDLTWRYYYCPGCGNYIRL